MSIEMNTEMSIDIHDLQMGISLGMPHSVGRVKQRAGLVGRTGPARFIIIAPRLPVPRGQPVGVPGAAGGARQAPSVQPNFRNTHGRCLGREINLNDMERAIPSPTDAQGNHPWRPPRAGAQTGNPQQPHRGDIRDATDGRAQHCAADAGRRDGADHRSPRQEVAHQMLCSSRVGGPTPRVASPGRRMGIHGIDALTAVSFEPITATRTHGCDAKPCEVRRLGIPAEARVAGRIFLAEDDRKDGRELPIPDGPGPYPENASATVRNDPCANQDGYQ